MLGLPIGLIILLLTDAAVVVVVIQLVNRGQETDIGTAIIIGVLIGMGCGLCDYFLGPTLGWFAFAPMVLVAIGVFWVVSGMPLERAALAGGLFFVVRAIFHWTIGLIF